MTVTEQPSGNDLLIVVADLPDLEPEITFDYWTKPDLITQWWPDEAEMDVRIDGSYHLAWPHMEWHLRGWYTTIAAGRELGFTWKWDHQPGTFDVLVVFDPRPDSGTRITLTHSPYSDSLEDQEARDGHLQGWTYFLTKLQGLTHHV